MNNYIYHHGVKGQKWGVRRYQNPDGSLTAAGQKKLEKQNFKDDVKALKSKGLKFDSKYDKYLDSYITTQWYDSRGAKIGKEYFDKVYSQAFKEKTVKSLALTSGAIAGAAVIGRILSKLR